MPSIIKGLLCQNCEKGFLFQEVEKKTYSMKKAFECPHCNTLVRYPKHLRTGFYRKVFFATLIFCILFAALLFYFDTVGVYASFFLFFIFYWWVKIQLKLQDGYIVMEAQ